MDISSNKKVKFPSRIPGLRHGKEETETLQIAAQKKLDKDQLR